MKYDIFCNTSLIKEYSTVHKVERKSETFVCVYYSIYLKLTDQT